MSEHFAPIVSPGSCSTALMVYRLGEAVVRFRQVVELYICDPTDGSDEDAEIPPEYPDAVDHCLGSLAEYTTLLAGDFPTACGFATHAKALRLAAEGGRVRLVRYWGGRDHQSLLSQQRAGLRKSDGTGITYWNWWAVTHSAFGTPDWAEYQSAADGLAAVLPPPFGPLYNLARLLAAVTYPRPSDYRPENHGLTVTDVVYLRGEVSPQITRLSEAVRNGLRCFASLPNRLEEESPYDAAIDLHHRILDRLAEGESDVPKPAERELASPAATPASAAILAHGESLEELIRIKGQIDPDSTYVGQSLPLLRMFKSIHDLNKQPDEPLVVLGPSGVGKTVLAKLVHMASGRKGSYLDLQANDIRGGDENIQRVKWVGYGRNAAFSGSDGKVASPGWLQAADGGTIFLDEIHNLDKATQQFLRKVMDRRTIPLAGGQGKPVTPNVRLVFATYREVEELQASGVLEADFVRRLRRRYLSVPPLDQRKEDILLFVERFRDGRQPGECFLLALFLESWRNGEVDRLIDTITRVAYRKPLNATMTVADLRGLVSNTAVDLVERMPDDERGRTLYGRLLSILEAQGFVRGGKKGNAIQERLAAILASNPATVSRRLKELHLTSATPTAATLLVAETEPAATPPP